VLRDHLDEDRLTRDPFVNMASAVRTVLTIKPGMSETLFLQSVVGILSRSIDLTVPRDLVCLVQRPFKQTPLPIRVEHFESDQTVRSAARSGDAIYGFLTSVVVSNHW